MIETIRGKSKRPDIDAVYRYISKSEATNIDREFIASVLNNLENQNVIYNKPTTQGLHSCFIASHTDKEDPKNIRSQPQNDNTQSDPEPNLFSNQPGHDLVSLDDTTPIVNSTVTTSNTKEFSNIKTHKHITVDKAISLEDEVQFIYSTVTTPAKENDMNFKNCENNDLKKHISKLEAQLSAIKSYINCEVSVLTNKIESISNDFKQRINTLLGKEKSKIEILQQNMTFLKNELLSKNEIIKSLMEIQSFVLHTMPKNTFTSEYYSPTQRQSLRYLQSQSEQRDVDVHSRFQRSRNQLHKEQNNETQNHNELYKNNRTQ